MNKANLSMAAEPYLFYPRPPLPMLGGCILSLPPFNLSATRNLSMMRIPHHPHSHVQRRFVPSSIDFDELLNKYPNVTKEELENLRDTSYSLTYFDYTVKLFSQSKETREKMGRHIEAGPLVQILSICILPDQVKVKKPLAIYGRIYVEFRHFSESTFLIRDLFNRGSDDPEILSPSGNLTLTFPQINFDPGTVCMPLRDTRIRVDVWDATLHVAISQDSFLLEDATDGVYEKVNLKIVGGRIASVFVRYVAMPLSAACDLEVGLFRRKIDENEGDIDDVLNVYGKIVARYANTYGNYANEECTLFEKQSHEFEQVTPHSKAQNVLRMPRSWVSLPAYSSLIIDFELYDFDTKRPLFKGVVQESPQALSSYESFALDEYVLFVNMVWVPRWPGLCRLHKDKLSDVKSSKVPRLALPTMEVFSIFIGRQKKMMKTLKIFGSIEVYFDRDSVEIFRRDEKDAFELPEDSNFLPILDGPRLYDDLRPMEIKVDLKDVHGNLSIKGLIYWGFIEETFPPRRDTQLCSVIQGTHGFAAMQYSIFKSGFQASIEVSCEAKRSGCFGVHGSFKAGYDTYDYSSGFQQDHFRVVLFERDEQDMVSLGIGGGKIPLSRSIVIVPADNSALVIEANVMFVDQLSGVAREVMSHFVKFEVGQDFYSLETKDCIIDISVEWTQIRD